MDRAQIEAMRVALRESLRRLDAVKINCASCKSWAGASCSKFDMLPPPEVVREGCEEWQFDGVVF